MPVHRGAAPGHRPRHEGAGPRQRPRRRLRRAVGLAAAGVVAASSLAVGAGAAAGDEPTIVEVPPGVAEEASTTGAVDVIVQLADPGGSLAPAALAADAVTAARAGERLVAEVGSGDADVLGNLGVVSMRVAADQLDDLAASPLVQSIEADITFAPALDTVASTVHAGAAWGAGLTGRNRSVVVIDSGVDTAHPALAGKVLYEACFTNESCPGGTSVARGTGAARPCTFGSQCDHGTHVAGITAGSHPTYSGLAPGAGIVAVQVFSRSTNPAECGVVPVPCPRARASDVLAALEEAYTLRASFPGIVAVNMSLSSDSAQADCSASVLRTAVDKLRAAGIATIVASGNGGSQSGLGVPACIPSTISVGASTPDGASLWQLSNVSDQLDLVAPGVGVVSPAPGGGFSGTTGTSAAAPVVAGAWALASEAFATSDVATIEAALEQSATPIPYGAEGRTVRRLDLAAIGGAGAPFGPQDLFLTLAGSTDQAGPGYRPLQADFGGDGLDDILWYHERGRDWLWTATGGGRFSGSVTPEIPAGYRPVAGDFNGDGRDDLFLFGPGNVADWVWFSTGSSADHSQFSGVQSFQIDGSWEVFPGDFNGDRRGDVFLFDRVRGDNHVWFGSGHTGAGSQFWGSPAVGATGPYKPVTGDFDGDGRSDIFWYGPGDHSDWLWFGTGSMSARGQFRDMQVFGVTGDYRLHSGDFNGDRRTDLLFYLPGPADEQIWFNEGGGSFRGVVMKVDAPYTPIVGNFDGDAAGKADVFWSSEPVAPPDVLWLSK